MKAWKPLTLGQTLSGGRGPSLGQFVSSSVVQSAASAAVSAAEPRFRKIIQEERGRVAKAAMETIPYTGVAMATYLATSYFVPEGMNLAKGLGYAGAAGLAAWGAWQGLQKLRGPEVPPTEAPAGFEFLQPVTRQLAQAIVAEAEPRLRQLVTEERERLGGATETMLPWAALGAAAFFGTMFLVPKTMPVAKAVGYTGATSLGLLSLWKGLAVAAA